MNWQDPASWFSGMDLAPWEYGLIVLLGIFTGIINTLAGSGSLITLPIFILMCGLPANVANGTNRIGVVIQSAVGLIAYKRSGKLVTEDVQWLAIPSMLGSLLGLWFAVRIDKEAMNLSIGLLMLFMLVVLLVNPQRWLKAQTPEPGRQKRWGSILFFFLIGVYGGFIQAGVGIFLLAAMVLSTGYSLSAANGIKMLLVFLFNLLPLIGLFFSGLVHVGFGLLLAVAQSVGALIGVRYIATLPKADVWIHRLLILIVLVSGVKMIWEFWAG